MSISTLSEQAYRLIRRKLTSGELTAGKQISEPSLAKELGMSRTPVREALRKLEFEGFLEQVPRHGTLVRKLDRQDVDELYEVRELLESHAAAVAALRITPADIEMLEQLCQQMREIADELRKSGQHVLCSSLMQRFLAVDLGFHMLMIRSAGNRRIIKIVADSQLLTRIFTIPRERHDLSVVAGAYRFHRRILRAVKQRNSEAAKHWMSEHIHSGRQRALKAFVMQQSEIESEANRAFWAGLPEDVIDELSLME